MHTKLTLRLDEDLIRRAKVFASSNGKSVSQVVADYFALLGREAGDVPITPAVRSLRGVLWGADVDDYHGYLEDKYLYGQDQDA